MKPADAQSLALGDACFVVRALNSLSEAGTMEGSKAMLAARSPLGLLGKDTHAAAGDRWGNLPQTYSMVGLINGAVRLSAPWDTVI